MDKALSNQKPKPPFHAYGRGNITPSIGGVLYGQYMLSHNTGPQRGENKPKSKQVHCSAERMALERQHVGKLKKDSEPWLIPRINGKIEGPTLAVREVDHEPSTNSALIRKQNKRTRVSKRTKARKYTDKRKDSLIDQSLVPCANDFKTLNKQPSPSAQYQPLLWRKSETKYDKESIDQDQLYPMHKALYSSGNSGPAVAPQEGYMRRAWEHTPVDQNQNTAINVHANAPNASRFSPYKTQKISEQANKAGITPTSNEACGGGSQGGDIARSAVPISQIRSAVESFKQRQQNELSPGGTGKPGQCRARFVQGMRSQRQTTFLGHGPVGPSMAWLGDKSDVHDDPPNWAKGTTLSRGRALQYNGSAPNALTLRPDVVGDFYLGLNEDDRKWLCQELKNDPRMFHQCGLPAYYLGIIPAAGRATVWGNTVADCLS